MSDWRVPVKMREPVQVTSDKLPPSADIRIYQWTGAIAPVGGILVRDLVGYGKVIRIKSIHAVLDNTAGVHTQSYIQFAKIVDQTATIFCELIIHVDAATITYVDAYANGDTALVDTNVWTYAMPDILLSGDFSILFFPNVNVDGEYTMLYEVYDA